MSESTVVTGVSGVFLESHDPKKLADWYAQSFGLQFHYWPERRSYGTEFIYDEGGGPKGRKSTVFVIRPGQKAAHGGFKVQFRVGDVQKASDELAKRGASRVSSEEFEYGNFTQLHDPDGNTIELYQPK